MISSFCNSNYLLYSSVESIKFRYDPFILLKFQFNSPCNSCSTCITSDTHSSRTRSLANYLILAKDRFSIDLSAPLFRQTSSQLKLMQRFSARHPTFDSVLDHDKMPRLLFHVLYNSSIIGNLCLQGVKVTCSVDFFKFQMKLSNVVANI